MPHVEMSNRFVITQFDIPFVSRYVSLQEAEQEPKLQQELDRTRAARDAVAQRHIDR